MGSVGIVLYTSFQALSCCFWSSVPAVSYDGCVPRTKDVSHILEYGNYANSDSHSSFLGQEALHLRAWLPSNHRAFIAAVQYHYSIPTFVAQSNDPRLKGVLEGIVEAYTGERGFMGVHRYKVFGILEVAAKTGRTATNGLSGAADATRPWEETHRQFSDAMKERLEPFRGKLDLEPHSMRGSFEECRYLGRVAGVSPVDKDRQRFEVVRRGQHTRIR